MATAEELLARLADPTTEPHIVINTERFITVPDELKRIAVQFDHDIETVTFDCPRYWDGNDMSTMNVYVNYKTPDNRVGSYYSQLITIDPSDSNVMHFTWTISNNVTRVKGSLSFLVCIKKVDSEGNEVNHWNSELNRQMTISEGLECEETILEEYPDVITHILTRLDTLEALGGIDDSTTILELDTTLKIAGRAADAAVVGTELKELEDALASVRAELNTKVDTIVHEVDLTDVFTVDPSSTEQQTLDISDIIDTAALKAAIDEGKTVSVAYTDPDPTDITWDSNTLRVKLSVLRRYVLDSSLVITLSGLVMRTSAKRCAEIKLILIGDTENEDLTAWIYYTPDSVSETSSDNSDLSATDIHVSKVDSTITVTTTLNDGSTSESIITLDENELPKTITTDGVACDVTWEGF